VTTAPLEVGGTIRRIAIVTIRENSCAAYLARSLKDCGAEIAFVNQTRLKVELRSAAYFGRLLRKRGVLSAADNLLLYGAFLAREMLRRGEAAPDDPEHPVMREDPALRGESWLRFEDVEDINGEAGRRVLEGIAPDLVLLGGAPILGRRAIAMARVACLNPHCGIVPRYAGGSPFDWAIYERRFEDIGYTIHLVDPVVDSGPILHQERVPWDPALPNQHLWPVLAQAMYDKLAEIAREMVRGRRFTATPQPPARVLPPAGLVARSIAEMRRRAYARSRRAS
jgi:formyl transferase-like protein